MNRTKSPPAGAWGPRQETHVRVRHGPTAHAAEEKTGVGSTGHNQPGPRGVFGRSLPGGRSWLSELRGISSVYLRLCDQHPGQCLGGSSRNIS